MVGIPERLSRTQIPLALGATTSGTAQFFEMSEVSNTVQTALGTDSVIPFEDALPEVARVAPQLPFFDTPGGTKSEATRRNFQIAPPAKRTA
jgi:hypothetical protein